VSARQVGHDGQAGRSPLDDRRQRAREAGWDATAGWSQESTAAAIEAAIETATRVQVTPEAVRAFESEACLDEIDTRRGLTAALTELGFEVED
jgi:transketolase